MSEGRNVDLEEVLDAMREINEQGLSGTLSVFTNRGRTALISFSRGEIYRVQSRRKDVETVVQVLGEADQFRFEFMRTTDPDELPLLAVSEFISAIIAGSAPSLAVAETPVSSADSPGAAVAPFNQALLTELQRVTVEFTGPIGASLLEEAREETTDPTAMVYFIAEQIPDQGIARQFIEAALRLMSAKPQ